MRPQTRTALGLLTIVTLGVALRFVPAPRVFTFAYVNFQGDAWYHLRRLDWHLANFPASLTADPYAHDVHIPLPPLFDLILAAFVALAGWPAPGSYAADAAAAVAPAVLGGLVAIPTFLIARRVTSRSGAWTAALLAVVLPGPFLMRSTVGVSDHHVAETLFTGLCLAALMEAMNRSDRIPISISTMRWGALAGIWLGAYFLVWSGAAFIVPVLVAGVALEVWGDVLRGRSHAGRFAPLATAGMVALGLVALFQPRSLYRIDLQFLSLQLLIAFAAVGAALVSLVGRNLPPRAAAVTLALLTIFAGILAVRHPALSGFGSDLSRVFGGGASTVGETRSIASLAATPFKAVEAIFGWAFLGLPALGWLALRVLKSEARGSALLIAWISLTLIATIGQIRFGYYLVPNLAILLGVAAAPLWDAGRRRYRILAPASLAVVIAGSAPAIAFSLSVDEGAPLGWHQAMSWLRRTTPEPFGEPSHYFGAPRSQPEARVLTWWDYGYLVSRIGRRIALSNPTQHYADLSGRLLTAPLREDNATTFRDLKLKTVVVSDEMLMRLTGSTDLFGKYGTMLSWGGRDVSHYMIAADDVGEDGRPRKVWLFLPDYFSSLAVHLYVYAGRAVAARDVSVVTLEPGPTGEIRIAASKSLPDHAAAEAYRLSLGPGHHILASRDPLQSCIDLPARDGFRLAFESDDAQTTALGRPSVRVFSLDPRP